MVIRLLFREKLPADGKNIWEDEKKSVPNQELKGMVEFYKGVLPLTKRGFPCKLRAQVRNFKIISVSEVAL